MSHSCYYLVVKQRTSPRSKTCSETKKTEATADTMPGASELRGQQSHFWSLSGVSIYPTKCIGDSSIYASPPTRPLPSSFYLGRH